MSTIKRLLIIVTICGVMQAVESFGDPSADPRRAASALVVGIGFVLIASWFSGRIFSTMKLPKLTGYLAMGMVAGPLLGLLAPSTVSNMGLVNGMATALIALTGGSEMDFRAMRPLFKSIAWISLIAVVGTAVALSLLTWILAPQLTFMAGLSPLGRIAISLVVGIVTVAQSPAVVVAIRAETGADGPVARTSLGVVVLADLLVIVLFAIASSAADAVLSGTSDFGRTAREMIWELFGSLGIGISIGAILSAWLRFVGERGLDLFVLLVCFVAAEVGRRVHLDPLLLMLAAGMFVENVSRRGAVLRRAFEDASLPVYILFFTVAGASVHLHELPTVALPAALFILVRGFGLYFGTSLAARVSGADPAVRKFGGFGLLPQAGLAIALSQLFSRTFPSLGPSTAALTLSIVAINEIVAPAIFRVALVRSGEAVTPATTSSVDELPAVSVPADGDPEQTDPAA
jgi:Kef-type K+ transport system membrane component KefB